MSKLYSELTNLYDQDVMFLDCGREIFEWLLKHKEEINNIEIDYLDIISNLQKEVTDLEAKLTQREHSEKSNIKNIAELTKMCTERDRKISDLEAKLAESEKEIEKLNACVDFYKSYYISFKEKVIDELEKVKEKINNCPITDYDTNKHFVKMYQSDAIRQLDNQINQLKEGEVV